MPRKLTHHPRRYALANELHARPFQSMPCPGRVVHLAFKKTSGAADREPQADRDHLTAFLDMHGAPHPAPEASHYMQDLGRFRVTWERHTEFVSYTLYQPGEAEDGLFEADLLEQMPQEWLDTAPGSVVAATQIELIEAENEDAAEALVDGPLLKSFNPESLAFARVLDGSAHALGDFRIHEEGLARFALVVYGDAGPRRIGRLVQRLVEVETYRAVAMLALPIARTTSRRLTEIEREMTRLIDQVAHDTEGAPEGAILSELTELAAELEAMSSATAFRFGAAKAYEAIVEQRVAMLREERLGGRQLFSEFMARRFDPAMRTCHAAERRLSDLSIRAGRIAELLRTRVNVAVESQNQRLLASMDQRAGLQLRLQQTVEGLSVVAISYYAVSLAEYFLAPFAERLTVSEETLTAIVAVPIILAVWGFVRRVRRGLGHD